MHFGHSGAIAVPKHLTKSRDFYRIGDVVTLRDRVAPMTVESIKETSFGLSLSCCWFDDDDSLHFVEHPAAQLDLFPRQVSSPSIIVGTELRLRSRGPVMTVLGIESLPTGRFATCEWTGPTGGNRQRLFPVHGLVLSMMDQLEQFKQFDGALGANDEH